MEYIGLTEEELAINSEISSLSNLLVPLEKQAIALVERDNLEGAYTILYGDGYVDSMIPFRTEWKKKSANAKHKQILPMLSHILHLQLH